MHKIERNSRFIFTQTTYLEAMAATSLFPHHRIMRKMTHKYDEFTKNY